MANLELAITIVSTAAIALAAVARFVWFVRNQISDVKKMVFDQFERHGERADRRHMQNLRRFARLYSKLKVDLADDMADENGK